MPGDRNPTTFSISEDWSGAIPLNELMEPVRQLAVPFERPESPGLDRGPFTEEIVSDGDPVATQEVIVDLGPPPDTQEAAYSDDDSLVSEGRVYGWDDLDDPASFTATVASEERSDGAVLRDLLQPSQSLPMAQLVTVKGHPVSRFKVNRGGVTFGRSEDRDVVLLQRTASRNHAEIRWESSGFVIVDLGSSNGVFVNERRVQEALLEHGDTVEVGDAVFTWVQSMTLPMLSEATATAAELTEPWEGQLLVAAPRRQLVAAVSTPPTPNAHQAPVAPDWPEAPAVAQRAAGPAGAPDGGASPAPAADPWAHAPLVGQVPDGATHVYRRPQPLPASPQPTFQSEFQLSGPRETPIWLLRLALGAVGVALLAVAGLGYAVAGSLLGGPDIPVGDPVAYARYMDLGTRSLARGDHVQAAMDFGLANQAQPGQEVAERMERYANEFVVVGQLEGATAGLALESAEAAADREDLLDRAAVAAEGRSRTALREVLGEVEAYLAEAGSDQDVLAAQDALRARLAWLGPAPRRLTQAEKDARAGLERCEQSVANRDHRTAYECLGAIVARDRSARLPGGQRAAAALAVTVTALEEKAKPHYQRGVADLAAHKPVQARDAFQAALRIYPEHAPAERGLSDAMDGVEKIPSEHMTRARVYQQAHRVDKAVSE